MNPDDQSQDEPFSASLPLSQQPEPEVNAAADLIRQKVEAAFQNEPNATEEALDVAESIVKPKSRHQQFISELTMSGKSVPEIQTAWHEYYAGLNDEQKHQVWREFEQMHARASRFPTVTETPPEEKEQLLQPEPAIPVTTSPHHSPLSRTVADLRDYVVSGINTRGKLKPKQHLQSLLFGLGMGSVVILVLLFGFFNERFIAPFIQPSRAVTNTPIISDDTAISTKPEIIIPKINVEIPVVYDINTTIEADVDRGLEQGVVHYADTAIPGQNGNLVIVGHSSNNIFNRGKYKFAFVLLSRLDSGDTFYLQKDGKRYTYKIYEKKIVKPTDVSVLGLRDKPATATLITCDPPGTSTNRLVVVGEQISPDITSNTAQVAQNSQATKTATIPGNSPSLWSRLTRWISS
ncbi:class D sortase [Candidatus Saccharibacteria bacterium]|nr:class D sortase [Candidatus Saccharibacteria bacterium]